MRRNILREMLDAGQPTLGTHLLRLGAGAFTVLGLGCGGGHCQGKHKGKSRKRAALGKQGVGHKGLLCRPPTTSG